MSRILERISINLNSDLKCGSLGVSSTDYRTGEPITYTNSYGSIEYRRSRGIKDICGPVSQAILGNWIRLRVAFESFCSTFM